MFFRQHRPEPFLLSCFVVRHLQVIDQSSEGISGHYITAFFTFGQIAVLIDVIFSFVVLFHQLFYVDGRGCIEFVVAVDY